MTNLERYDPSISGRIKYEHFHRYAFASEFVSGAVVLDIASGEGYGSAVLSRYAKSVVGVDVDPRAVEAAERKYGKSESLKFMVGNADAMPFPDATFDVLVSLETMEHLRDPSKLMSEARRVLKPDGIIIVSSPNKTVYNRHRKEANEFHISEMELEEFTDLVSNYFDNVCIYGQRMMLASSVAPASGFAPKPNAAEYRGFTARQPSAGALTIEPGIARLRNPEYLVCLASNGPLPVLEAQDSLFLMATIDLWEEHSAIMAWASGLHDEDERLRAEVRELQTNQAKHDQSMALALAQAHAESLTELLAVRGRELERGKDFEQAAGMALMAPILSDLTEGPVGEDLRSIVHGLTRAAVRTAVHKQQLADLTSANERSRQAEAAQAERAKEFAQIAQEAETRARELAQIAQEAEKRVQHAQATQDDLENKVADLREDLEKRRAAEQQAEVLRTRLGNEVATLRDEVNARAKAVQGDLENKVAGLREDLEKRHAAEQQAEVLRTRLGNEVATLRDEVNARAKAVRDAEETLFAQREQIQFAAAAAVIRNTHLTIERLHRECAEQRSWGRANAHLAEAAPAAALRLKVTTAAFVAFEESALFVPDYYARIANIPADLRTAWKHFKRRGCVDGLDCNPLFLTSWMRAHHPALSAYSASFVAVAASGSYEQAMHPLFDIEYYHSANSLTLRLGETALQHYMRTGRRMGLATHPMIDLGFWQRTAPDGEVFDLVRYLEDSSWFRVPVHPFFDADYYLDTNWDVAEAEVNPLVHYCLYGWREGRDPNPLFDSLWYLATNPDVAETGMVPLEHYIRHGATEGRPPHPLFSPSYYLSLYPDVASAGLEPYAHYLEHGRVEGRLPSPQVAELAAVVPDWPRDRLVELIRDKQVETASLLAATAWSKLSDCSVLPGSDQTYYLPQKLRDYIIDRFGEMDIGFYVELFGIVDRFSERASSFDREYDVGTLAGRLSRLARLRQDSQPQVSIILPVYNNLVYTLTCIASVLETSSVYSFEIIVADDVSTDRTAEIISSLGGAVRHLRHQTNLGFLRNCNAAADAAAGDYLVFLNNDTIVLPGWLDGLIAPLVADPDVGLTGSKLLNGDGTLQEAGGIIWSDGSAWNYGRNQEPWLPEFNYVKDVDYISGASIALPSQVWRELSGFDAYYEPAYCEDSDLAFRVRSTGYRTLYQPRSMVVHHEGRSHGRDLSSGIKALQVTNQKKFFARWKDVLEADHFPNGRNVFVARDRSRRRPHILVIDHYVPQWDQDAGSKTMYDYLKTFAKCGFQVSFWSDNLFEDRRYTYHLQQLGIEVIYSHAYAGRYKAWLFENKEYLDYILYSRPHITKEYIDAGVDLTDIKKIYYGHDLHFRRHMKEYEIKKDPLLKAEIESLEALEVDICSRVDLVLFPSMEEVEIVRARVPSRVAVRMLPMNVLSDDVLHRASVAATERTSRESLQIMFVGGFSHTPNKDGIIWFVQQVMPLVREKGLGIRLAVAGSNATEDIRALASSDVEILGRISDEALADLYRESALSIAPLRYGGGVKGKVIEAMAAGVPIVTTTIGVQGMPDAHGFTFIADDSKDFADAIIRAIREPDEASARAIRAVEFLRNTYSEDAVRDRLAPDIPELKRARSA